MEVPKRIAVDFDGTICDAAFPEIGALKNGAREALTVLRTLGYKIIIWSCRTCHWDYDVFGGNASEPVMERPRVQAMVEFLDSNNIPYDEIDDGSKGKPGADFYIDDKAIRFDDNWVKVARDIVGHALDKDIVESNTIFVRKEGKLIPFPTGVGYIVPVADATGVPTDEEPTIA